ncbi:glucosaminylphosphatidylinositol acyltransferase [Nematocida sp. AWRm77]|nr:glucosaminylphosphatidylinositol acyltransferase [Nematocida sp. AWRm77]
MFSKTELLHTTSCSIYVAVIADYLDLSNGWVLLALNTLAHYAVSVSRTEWFSWWLCGLSGAMWAAKARRARTGTRTKGTGKEKEPRFTEEETRMLVNGFRYIVCSLVCISIFACDFSVYPAYKMKTEYFGLSLMDFGVVAFMFNAGILCAKSHRFRWRKAAYMLAMGCIRLGVLQSGYHSDPSEYGVHLNFYFVYLLAHSLSVLFRRMPAALACVFFFSVHEAVLASRGMVPYIFHAGRTTLVDANREGLVSLLPYTGVLFLGKYVGETVFQKDTCRRTGCRLLGLFVFLMGVHGMSSLGTGLGSSRRLCNLAFTSFSCGAILFPMAVFYLASSVYKLQHIEVLNGLSAYMGPFFLLANVYVLVGNVLFDWKKCSVLQAHCANILYLVLLFGVPSLYIFSPGHGKKGEPSSSCRLGVK